MKDKITCYGCENLIDSFGNFVECMKLHRFVDWYYWNGNSAPDDCPKKDIKNMTEEQVIKGSEILKRINELENEIKDIERLLTYLKEKEQMVNIQLHEKWVGTPYAKVSKTNFESFLNSEAHRNKLSIQSLKENLERI